MTLSLKQTIALALACMFCFPNEILGEFYTLFFFYKLCLHMQGKKTKLKQFSRESHDSHWENRTYMMRSPIDLVSIYMQSKYYSIIG